MMAHLKLPDPDNYPAVGDTANNALRKIWRDTVLAIADCMNAGARQLKLTGKQLTPEELEAAAKQLTDYVEKQRA